MHFRRRPPSAAIFAVRLALAGHDVSCVMRGPHLEAVQARGPGAPGGRRRVSRRESGASDNPAALGPQDVVISTLKATGLSSLAAGLGPLLGNDTSVVFAQNGIPWWYEFGLAPDHPPPDLGFSGSRRPVGAPAVARERIVGGVIFSANEIMAPGIVVNNSTDRNMLLVGECDDRPTERIQTLADRTGRSRVAIAVGRADFGKRSGPS